MHCKVNFFLRYIFYKIVFIFFSSGQIYFLFCSFIKQYIVQFSCFLLYARQTFKIHLSFEENLLTSLRKHTCSRTWNINRNRKMFFQYSQYIFYKILKELFSNQSLFIRSNPTKVVLAKAKSVNEKCAYKSVCSGLDVFLDTPPHHRRCLAKLPSFVSTSASGFSSDAKQPNIQTQT